MGSSKKKRLGSFMSSMATDTLFFWPPEMPFRSGEPTMECMIAEIPSISMAWCTIGSTWLDVLKPRRFIRIAEYMRLSYTVSSSYMMSS